MKRLILCALILWPCFTQAFMPDDEIAVLQKATAGWDTGDRIAFWAEQFVGVPYDTDPLGEYVRRNVIVADERVDCMYLTFRAVELALGSDPEESRAIALDKRFPGKGIRDNGKVGNYADRFRYGEDMIESGKWGREITTELGDTVSLEGSRGRSSVCVIPKKGVPGAVDRLRNGDIVFFVKTPEKRTDKEIVGHMGIIKRERDAVYLISAFGRKGRGGMVKKVLFSEYSAEMTFAGIKVTRLD